MYILDKGTPPPKKSFMSGECTMIMEIQNFEGADLFGRKNPNIFIGVKVF